MSESHPRFAGIGGHHQPLGRTDDWLTPPAIIDALGGAASFDLDPCASVGQPWPTARQHFTVHDNGLLRNWAAGRIWLNPPYKRSVIGRWLARMADHDHGTALIFARTETAAFFSFVWAKASALLFIRGRLDFHRPDGSLPRGENGRVANSGAPTVLCAYGRRDADVLACCGIDGAFVPLRLPRGITVMAIDAPWRDVVTAEVLARRGPVALADLYRAIARHPKASGRRHFEAKIRQVLQQGPFRRVAAGVWEAA